VVDRLLRGRFHLASSTGLLDQPYAAAKKKPQDSRNPAALN
jgi:hypothetical protein